MTDEPGVPLWHYRQHHPSVELLLTCNSCQYSRTFDLDVVITRLQRRGIGGPNTGIRQVAGYTLEDCPRCGKRNWETRPWWPSRETGTLPPPKRD